jgi:hypothetical protein
VNYSGKNDDLIEEFIDYCGGAKKIPNPEQYPRRFEFLVKSFKNYKNSAKSIRTEKSMNEN